MNVSKDEFIRGIKRYALRQRIAAFNERKRRAEEAEIERLASVEVDIHAPPPGEGTMGYDDKGGPEGAEAQEAA